MKLGVGFQRQLVPGEMLRRQGNGLLEICQSQLRGLPGQAMHEIQIEIIKARLTRLGHRVKRIFTAVNAPQGLELFLMKALDTQRKTIDTRLSVGRKAAPLEGPWIGLEGDFNVSGEGQPLARFIEQTLIKVAGHQARRPSTNKDTGELTPLGQTSVVVEIGQQGRQVRLFRQLCLSANAV